MQNGSFSVGRALCLALLFLLAGLLTTVAVAWALAAWLPNTRLSYRTSFFNSKTEPFRKGPLEVDEFWRPGMVRREWLFHDFGATVMGSLFMQLKGAKSEATPPRDWGRLPHAIETFERPPDGAIEDARGWPALALWCQIHYERSSPLAASPAQVRWVVLGGIQLPTPPSTRPLGDLRALPWRPVWSGIAIDTVMYGAAWGLVLFVPRSMRRLLRSRRGRCPSCGYDCRGLAADAKCPECGGAPIVRRHWLGFGFAVACAAIMIWWTLQNWIVAVGSIGLYGFACGVLCLRDRWLASKSEDRGAVRATLPPPRPSAPLR
jgi:hypothetical protein